MADDAQLDVVQHPTLGELKFPKDMPFEERNASIDRLEKSAVPIEKEAAAKPPVAPVAPSHLTAWSGRQNVFGDANQRLTKQQSDQGNTGAAAGVMGAAAVMNPMAIARGALKSFGASQAGKYIGRWGGKLVGGDEGAKTGEQLGERAGAVVGPFIGGKTLAKLPVIGQYVSSADDYAAVQAEREAAQSNARIKAGLEQHPGVPAHAEMEADFAKRAEAPPPLPQRAHAEMQEDLAKRAEAPPPLPVRAHAEMEADIAKGKLGRAAAHHEMERDIAAGQHEQANAWEQMKSSILKARQEQAAGRDVAYNDLAKARMARTGNPAMEGQQYPGVSPTEPRASGLYEERGNAAQYKDMAKAAGKPPQPEEGPYPSVEKPAIAPETPAATTPTATKGTLPTTDKTARAIAESQAVNPNSIPKEDWAQLTYMEKRNITLKWREVVRRAQDAGMVRSGRGSATSPYLSNEVIGLGGR